MSNQRLMKAKEKAGDGYAKTNAIAPPPLCRTTTPLQPRLTTMIRDAFPLSERHANDRFNCGLSS